MTYGIIENGKITSIYKTEFAANLAKDLSENPAAEVISISFTEPLDPEPWENMREGIRSAKLDKVEKGWAFYPRHGCVMDSGAYTHIGGIDPTPYSVVPENKLIKGRTRYEKMPDITNADYTFSPREGFEQDESFYKLDEDTESEVS